MPFKDYAKWSIDFGYDMCGELLPTPADVLQSRFGELIQDVGCHGFRIVEATQRILADGDDATTSAQEEGFEIPQFVLEKLQAYGLAYARTIHRILAELDETLDSFLTLCKTEASGADHAEWFNRQRRKYTGLFVEFVTDCIGAFWGGAGDQHQTNHAQEEPNTMKPSFYTTLGVDTTASEQEIKTVYRNLARTWHPDKVPMDQRDDATARFIQIKLAYDILSNDKLRWIYDHRGRKHALYARKMKLVEYEKQYPL